MPKNSPFTVIRDFLNGLQERTRNDAMFHIIINHSPETLLKRLKGNFDMPSEYDTIFSDEKSDSYSYLGKILALRSYIDFYIWSFTDETRSTQQYKLFDYVESGDHMPDSLHMLRVSWHDRYEDLSTNLPKWESMKNGPLSNLALSGYTSNLWKDRTQDQMESR